MFTNAEPVVHPRAERLRHNGGVSPSRTASRPVDPHPTRRRSGSAGSRADSTAAVAVGGLGRTGGSPARLRIAAGVALVSLALVVAEAAVDVLPDDPLVWLLTPLRLVVGVGVAAVVVTRGRWRPSALDAAVVALLGATALTSMLSGQGWASWRALLTTVAVAYLAAGLRRIAPASWYTLTLLAVLAVALAAVPAIAQVANGTPTGFCRASLDASFDTCRNGAKIRATGTFANPNLLAPFLVLFTPMAAWSAARAGDAYTRLLLLLPVLTAVFALVVTWSRGGYLAALAAGLAYLVLRRPTRLRVMLGGSVVALAAASAGLSLALGVAVGVRGDVWRAGLDLAFAHPWGVGLGRSGALLDAAILGREAFRHAHNLWLTWLIEAGWLGLVATVAITILVAARIVPTALAGSRPAALLGAGLFGFATAALVDHPANAERLALALAVLLGLAAAERVAPRPQRPGRRARPASRRT